MASTNKTTNLELSQFLGSDSPKWLTDYNADMQKIDTAVGTVQSQADATDLVVSGHSTAIESLQTTEGEQGTAIESLRTDVNHNAGDISTINSLIGNGEPTTTDKTLIGAINELNADVTDLEAVKTLFTSTNTTIAQVTGDGVKTVQELLAELHTATDLYFANLAADKIVIPNRLVISSPSVDVNISRLTPKAQGAEMGSNAFDASAVSATQVTQSYVRFATNVADNHVCKIVTDSNGTTYTQLDSNVVPNGEHITLYGRLN